MVIYLLKTSNTPQIKTVKKQSNVFASFRDYHKRFDGNKHIGKYCNTLKYCNTFHISIF